MANATPFSVIDASSTNKVEVDFNKANAFLGDTPRFRRLDRLEAYYYSLQHEGKSYDWDGNEYNPNRDMDVVSSVVQVPAGYNAPALKDKRPTVMYNICRIVVNRFTDLLFSDKRKPIPKCSDDPDTDDFIKAVATETNLNKECIKIRRLGGIMGSAVLTFVFRDGNIRWEAINSKTCTPTWQSKADKILASLEIQYKYQTEEFDKEKRKVIKKNYAYRRTIDDKADTLYQPALLAQDGSVKWEVKERVEHGFGFCPAVWVENLDVDEDVDGAPDCEYDVLDIQDDIAKHLSQQSRAILKNMDPSVVVITDSTVGSIAKGSDNAIKLPIGSSASYMEINASGITASEQYIEKMRKMALEMASCVLTDPDKASGSAQSGKALEYLYTAMTGKADTLRSSYGDAIVKALVMLLAAVRTLGKIVIKEDGTQEVREITGLSLRNVIEIDPKTGSPKTGDDGKVVVKHEKRIPGKGVRITLDWGDYFEASDTDIQAATATATTAKAGGVISAKTATQYVARYFGIHDVEAEIKEIAKENPDAYSEQFHSDKAGGGAEDGEGGKGPGKPGGGFVAKVKKLGKVTIPALPDEEKGEEN